MCKSMVGVCNEAIWWVLTKVGTNRPSRLLDGVCGPGGPRHPAPPPPHPSPFTARPWAAASPGVRCARRIALCQNGRDRPAISPHGLLHRKPIPRRAHCEATIIDLEGTDQ